MSLRGIGATHTGLVRAGNEDAFLVEAAGEDLLLAVVADGLGGHQAGEVASRYAVEEFRRMVSTGEFGPAEADQSRRGPLLRAAAFAAHDVIAGDGARNRERFGMATTLTAVLAGSLSGTLIQVGDSRCYRWRDRTLEPLSTDQTVARELLDAGEIDLAGYAKHPDRNRLSQCLGFEAWDMPLKPVLAEFDFLPGDRLLLCSDGLTDMVDDRGIAAILGADGPLEDVVAALQQAALAAGGHDNVTIVLVEVRVLGQRATEVNSP